MMRKLQLLINHNCLMNSQEEFLSDLECGGMTSKEGSRDSMFVSKTGEKALIKSPRRTSNCNGLISGDHETNISYGFTESKNVTGKIEELSIEQSSGGEDCKDFVVVFDKRNPNDQCKNLSIKKASKPPRPPNSPLLSASDIKLVKRLSELAARKRARIERMKASRKMKEVKHTSLGSNLNAMIITILFFVVIIFQGVSCTSCKRQQFHSTPNGYVSLPTLLLLVKSNGLVSMFTFIEKLALGSNSWEIEGKEHWIEYSLGTLEANTDPWICYFW